MGEYDCEAETFIWSNFLHSPRRITRKRLKGDAFLLDTVVAGTTHLANAELLEPDLHLGERFFLIRIPENPSDPFAIKIFTADGEKVGYISRKENLILSRLMDAGKQLFAVLCNKEWVGNWLKLEIRIYLHEE